MSGRLGTVAFGLGLAALAAYQQFKLPVVLPLLLTEYHYDRTLAGGFMSVYAVAGLALSVPVARAVQLRGTVHFIIVALALMIVGCGATLLYPESGWLVLGARGLEGAAMAILAICGPVLANAAATPAQLPVVVGLTASWIPVGQLSASFLAPIALSTGGWQGLWYVGIAAALAFMVWALRIRRSLAEVIQPKAIGEVQTAETLAPRQTQAIALAGIVFLLWSGQYFAYMTWLPQYLVEQHGLSLSRAQWGYAIPVFLVLGFCIITGMILKKGVPVSRLLVGGLAAQVAVWALLPFTQGPVSGLVSLTLYGMGAGTVAACLFAMPSTILGSGTQTARAFGMMMTGRNMGVLIGPVLLAQAFKLTGTWDLAAPIFSGVAAVCFLIAIVLVKKLRAT